jgi:hypothetical protein
MSFPERFAPLEEHPQKIRECSIFGEMPRVSIGVPLAPGSDFLLENISNRSLVGAILRPRNRTHQHGRENHRNFHGRLLEISVCDSNNSQARK